MDRDQNHTHTITFSQQITYTHHVRPLWSVILPMFLFVIFYTSVFANTYSYSLIQHAHLLWNSLPLSTLFLSLSRSVIFHHNQTFALFWYTFKELFYWTPFCFHFHLFIIPFVLNWKHSHDYSFTYIWQDMLCVSFLLCLSLALKTKITTRLNVLYYYLYS